VLGLSSYLLGFTFSFIRRITSQVTNGFLNFTFNIFSSCFYSIFDRHNNYLPLQLAYVNNLERTDFNNVYLQ